MHIKELKDNFIGGVNKTPNHKLSIKNPNVNSLHLNTGEKTNVLVVDVDEPDSPEAKEVRRNIRRNDFIVYSSKYTINDVFNGKCRFKVFYEYHGQRLPRKKKNHNVEIFYGDKNVAGFNGKRGDGYVYKISSLSKGEIKPIHFDINEVVEVKIKEFDLFEKKKPKKKQDKKKNEAVDYVVDDDLKEEEIVGYDKVNIKEFQKQLSQLPHIIKDIPDMQVRGDIITFNCLFGHVHSDRKNANAYAFKKEGVYVAQCHGQVCNEHYWKLNKELKELALNQINFKNSTGFGDFEDNHVLFKAPTGWGKTEAIAEEVLKAINNNDNLLVLLQSKEAIARLSDRINEKSGGAYETLFQMGKIYIYTSENKNEEHELQVEKANVIVSHHYYFKNAGNILTYYKDSLEMLNKPDLKLIVDEAHTYIELASRMDLEVGGLYKKETFAGMDLWTANRKRLTAEEVYASGEDYKVITSCLDATTNDFFSVELQKQWKLYPQVDYLDVVSTVENHKDYEMVDLFQEDEIEYSIFENSKVKPIKANSPSNEQEGLHLLTDSAEKVIIARSKGDDKKRKQIGRVTFSAFHTQILKSILTKPKQVLLTTATWEEYHEDIVSNIVELKRHEEKEKVGKIGKIVLLRPKDQGAVRIRRQVLETTNDLNARALLFFPTIGKAKEVAKQYDNIMMNDNGMYSIGKRKSSVDYVDNFVRNVTVAGLESSVAKGYNYLEEVDGNTNGFELIYFDKKPVSPSIIKKYFNPDGQVVDYQSDYKWSTFAQAIGRTFRKSKDVLCVAMNDINNDDYELIKNYISNETNAEIVEDTLNIMNIKISIPSFINSVGFDYLSEKLKDNKLFNKIYLKK